MRAGGETGGGYHTLGKAEGYPWVNFLKLSPAQPWLSPGICYFSFLASCHILLPLCFYALKLTHCFLSCRKGPSARFPIFRGSHRLGSDLSALMPMGGSDAGSSAPSSGREQQAANMRAEKAAAMAAAKTGAAAAASAKLPQAVAPAIVTPRRLKEFTALIEGEGI